MFEDAFLPNLVVFALGQIAAWGYLRTGLLRRGAVLMVVGWILADVVLLARFAYPGLEWVSSWALLALQIYSVAEFALFVFGRWRRRSSRWQEQRQRLSREAFGHYLRDEFDAAAAIYRRLLARDPWDLDSKLSLATLLARRGDQRGARSMLRGARALDRNAEFADFIALEVERQQS